MWLQQSRNQSPQVWNRPRKVVHRLSDEFQGVVRERQNFLARALGQLQDQWEWSRLQLLHTQVLIPGLDLTEESVIASGTPVCLENYPGDIFYGAVTTSVRNRAAACPMLIPFLKQLTAALVGAQGLEDQRPGTGPHPNNHCIPLCSDTDKANFIWASPFFSILKKTDIWSQVHKEDTELQKQVYHKPDPKSSLQYLLQPQTVQKEELITVQPIGLSAREFVVYQYGLSILHLLIPQLHAPEITLKIASHLPAMEAQGSAFQDAFFYQSAENTLFIGRECLASVGSFVLLLIRCLAHITAGEPHRDSNPAFLGSFYKGLKAYFTEAFSNTLRMSAVSRDNKLDQSISTILLEEQPISERERDLLSKLIEMKHASPLEPESLKEI
ncbi:uncharacterized protein LOC108295457 [Cebus imitator]|uniref:uncharacterized protein LOC108295457 n=1 Tax=Cebus imitator TaxID=2715852 RepID=UPI00080A496C|nr:uncharacterized protein LOC108295457 [Cebus imitator]